MSESGLKAPNLHLTMRMQGGAREVEMLRVVCFCRRWGMCTAMPVFSWLWGRNMRDSMPNEIKRVCRPKFPKGVFLNSDIAVAEVCCIGRGVSAATFQ